MTNGPILSIRDLYKSFGPKKVHQGVSFDLHHGEILALFGGSGSGKSVILRSIIGLEHPDSGQILFENIDVTDYTEEQFIEVRKKVGYVFQNGALFDSMTVEENLAYPLEEHTSLTEPLVRERIEQMLDLIGLKGSEKLLLCAACGIIAQGGENSFAGVQTGGIFTALIRLRDALNSDNVGAMDAAWRDLGGAHEKLLDSRGELGARAAGLEMTRNRLDLEKTELEKLRSSTRDIDLADAATRFQIQQTVLQASLAAAARILETTLLNYLQ